MCTYEQNSYSREANIASLAAGKDYQADNGEEEPRQEHPSSHAVQDRQHEPGSAQNRVMRCGDTGSNQSECVAALESIARERERERERERVIADKTIKRS